MHSFEGGQKSNGLANKPTQWPDERPPPAPLTASQWQAAHVPVSMSMGLCLAARSVCLAQELELDLSEEEIPRLQTFACLTAAGLASEAEKYRSNFWPDKSGPSLSPLASQTMRQTDRQTERGMLPNPPANSSLASKIPPQPLT